MSKARDISRPSTAVTTETVIYRPALKTSELQEISPLPMTPISAETVVYATAQAPKKPMAKMLEFLKPTSYKPDADSNPSAPKRILDALSRAGVRKSPWVKKKEHEKKAYPAPRKLTVHIVDGKTDAVIYQWVHADLLTDISPKVRETLESEPWADRYKIYGDYSAAAMSGMLAALTHHLPIPVSTPNLLKNLLTYEASLRLGISHTHALLKPLLTSIYTQISAVPISQEVLTFITYHLGTKDPVFTHMANVLCHQRFTKCVPYIRDFEKMLARKPALQRAMRQIDQAHEARREAFRASKQTRADAGVENTSDQPDVGIEETAPKQTIVDMLEAAALEKKNDPVQKETLLSLFKNEGTAREGTNETKKADKTDKTEKLESMLA